MKKNTDDLHQELMEEPKLDQFLSDNQEHFLSGDLVTEIQRICKEKKLSKAALARNACISEIYLHQILAGRRNPSRDRLICLCFGLALTLEQTQSLLRLGRFARLYPRDPRDAMIEHGILHGTPLTDLNEALFSRGLEPLY